MKPKLRVIEGGRREPPQRADLAWVSIVIGAAFGVGMVAALSPVVVPYLLGGAGLALLWSQGQKP